jgi:Cu(I)/Ag(I) efflux system membrane fusion protein
MINFVSTFRPVNQKLFVQHCPMADNDRGADWLSLSREIRNPYYGEAMLTCGEVSKEIN